MELPCCETKFTADQPRQVDEWHTGRTTLLKQRQIGSLRVSVVGLGCNQFGQNCDAAESADIVREALDAGINFFDTADEYGPDGVSEEFLGQALGARRDEVVIATKFGHHMFGDPERGGAGQRWIVQAVEDSLRRLGTDRIDLYQQHFPDPATPHEETMTALDRLVQDGKVREIGCCNLSGADVDERADISQRLGSTPLASAQNRLNLLRQEAVTDLVPALKRHDMALIPYFPLAAGMLTDKYKRGEPLPEGTRLSSRHVDRNQALHMIERDAPRVEALSGWAAEHGYLLSDLALAWLLANPVVATVITGATRPAQIAANARAAELELSEDDAAAVAAIGRGEAPSEQSSKQ